MPLYKTESPIKRADATLAGAASTYSKVSQKTKSETDIEKTAGGAISSGAGMAAAGATIGAATVKGSAGGPYGAAIGFVVGVGAYLLS
jgi:hypothetical protein